MESQPQTIELTFYGKSFEADFLWKNLKFRTNP